MSVRRKLNTIKSLAAELCSQPNDNEEEENDIHDDYNDYDDNDSLEEEQEGEEVLQDVQILHELRQFKNYRMRPPLSELHGKLNSKRDGIVFQLNELKYETDNTLYDQGKNGLFIRIFGVTQRGYSICANVFGFMPYFAVRWKDNEARPEDIAAFKAWLENRLRQRLGSTDTKKRGLTEDIESDDNDTNNRTKRTKIEIEYDEGSGSNFRYSNFKQQQQQHATSYKKLHERVEKLVVGHEICTGYGVNSFDPERHTFVKIYFAYPGLVRSARMLIEEEGPETPWKIPITYEADVDFVVRYMADNDYTGEMTLLAPPGSYRIITDGSEIRTNTDIEITIDDHTTLQPIADGDPRYITMGKKVFMSLDGEMEPFIKGNRPEGRFPRPHLDRVLQIGVVLWVEGMPDSERRFVFCLGRVSSEAIRRNHPAAVVFWYSSEAAMLSSFREFVVATDPDVLTGYNIENFDIPYLIERAETLAKQGATELKKFPYLGRVRYRRSRVKAAKFESRAHGRMDRKETNIDGRVQFDMLYICQKAYKLRSYKLEAISQKFLGVGKEEMDYEMIPEYQKSRYGRTKLASYVLTDALRPKQLIEKLRKHVDCVQMARVNGVTIQSLLRRGMGFRLKKQLYTWVRKPARTITNLKGEEIQLPKTEFFIVTRTDAERQRTAAAGSYMGAVVSDAERGQYESPVGTLDFSSLYPSIMIESNMSPDTLTTVAEMKAAGYERGVDYIQIPDYKFDAAGCSFEEVYDDSNVCFVTQKIRKGIIPSILECLLGERKKAKGRMAAAGKAGDSFTEMLMDFFQLNLKLCANSIYGGFGAATSFIYCKAIAASVTRRGRAMILKTRVEIEKKFCKANGYPCDVKIVYGDTDSVFAHCPGCSMEQALSLCKEMSVYASSLFGYPHKLEAEKVYKNLIIYKKKKYAGIKYEIDQSTMTYKPPVRNIMGLESVRRDNCIFVVETQDNIITILLSDKSREERIKEIKSYIRKQTHSLLCQKVTWDRLIISGQLRNHPDEYKSDNAVSSLAKRINIRTAGAGYIAGDRVPYVIVQKPPGTKTIDCSEDPEYAWKNHIPIDVNNYYLKQQLMPAVMRTLAPILTPHLDIDNTKEKKRAFEIMIGQIFWGPHMNIRVAQRSDSSLDELFQPVPTCFHCKCVLNYSDITSHTMLCKDCSNEHGDDIMKKLSKKLEKQHIEDGQRWLRCQDCVGAGREYVAIDCKNWGCDNMWGKVHTARNIQDIREKLDATVKASRMDLCW